MLGSSSVFTRSFGFIKFAKVSILASQLSLLSHSTLVFASISPLLLLGGVGADMDNLGNRLTTN